MKNLLLSAKVLIFLIFQLILYTELMSQSNTSKVFEEGLNDYIKKMPVTNRDSENNEWRKNVYRNKYYKFRIEFPKEWEYDDGSSKTTLARSFNREIGATISVFVSHIVDYEKPSEPNDIVKSIPLKLYTANFDKYMALQKTQAQNIEIKTGSLNNFSAYLLTTKTLESSGERSFMYISKQIHCYRNGLLYQIALNIPIDYYNSSIELLFIRVIDSFKFENYL